MSKIEETKREMYRSLATVRGTVQIFYSVKDILRSVDAYEHDLEDHLEALRKQISDLLESNEMFGQIQEEHVAMIQKYDQDSKHRAAVASHEAIHAESSTPTQENDQINSPAHYSSIPGFESIDVIQSALTPEEFAGFCKGNMLKYRFRAGKKGPAEICIGKADWYESRLKSAVSRATTKL